jgi:membrane protein DedA with SNARE-associated domain
MHSLPQILTFQQMIDWLLAYRYLVLFPIMVIEGPIVTIIAGFLASLDLLNVYVVFGVIIVADLTGDFIYYAIGRWGREGFINRWGKFIGLNAGKVEKVEAHFSKHRKKTLILGKLSHAVGMPILVAAGIAKVPVWEFFWLNLAATVPKSFIFLFIGYHFGQAYVKLDKYLDYFTLTIVILGIVLALIYFSYSRYKYKYLAFIQRLKHKNLLKDK